MEDKLKELVDILTKQKKTISFMESCTGGGLCNSITNIEGSSEVFKFGAVTYSNEYKIKLGVDKKVIDDYSVYSIETAKEMSKKISEFSNADYGVGITGKLNRIDKNNLYGEDNIVFVSIYDACNKKYHISSLKATESNRKGNKLLVINSVIDLMLDIAKPQ